MRTDVHCEVREAPLQPSRLVACNERGPEHPVVGMLPTAVPSGPAVGVDEEKVLDRESQAGLRQDVAPWPDVRPVKRELVSGLPVVLDDALLVAVTVGVGS